jgi:choline kinase
LKNTTEVIRRKKGLSVIIPAAGIGSRMKSYGPKPLIRVGNQSLVRRQIEILRDCFYSPEIVVVSGYESCKVMNSLPNNIIKIENERYSETNVSRSIALGLRACTREKVLIVYGDLLFNKDTFKNINLASSCLFIDESGCMTKDEVGCNISNKKVQYLIPDIGNKWAQIIYLKGRELELFSKNVFNRDNDRKFGFEIINNCIEKGGAFDIISPKNMRITDIDTSKDLLIAKKILV